MLGVAMSYLLWLHLLALYLLRCPACSAWPCRTLPSWHAPACRPQCSPSSGTSARWSPCHARHLQPYVVEPATVRSRACNRMQRSLQPYVRPSHAVLCRAVPCCAVLCRAVPCVCRAMPRCAVRVPCACVPCPALPLCASALPCLCVPLPCLACAVLALHVPRTRAGSDRADQRLYMG